MLGVTLYTGLKFVHVFAAIVAVGTNVTYGVWFAMARRSPDNEMFALRGIKFLDDRVANPAYAVLLIAGILTVLEGHWSFGQLWIALGCADETTCAQRMVETPELRWGAKARTLIFAGYGL